MRFVTNLILLVCLGANTAFLVAAEDTLYFDDGVTVRVLWFEPDTQQAPPPLAVLMTGGSNNEFMARAQFWMGKELVNRGWAIAVPISNQGRKFFVENSGLLPQVIKRIRENHAVTEDKALLVGISSGGSAALAIAAQTPDNYRGVIAAPGRLWEEDNIAQLDGLPIFLRVGAKDDFRWHRKLEHQAQILKNSGAVVNAALVADAHHIFPLDWSEVEAWLQTLPQPD